MGFSKDEEAVYEILSKILQLKFKGQIKNSGITLKEIHEMKNLQNGELEHVLIVDGLFIRFKSPKQFLLNFISHLKKNLNEMNEEFQQLQYHRNHDLAIDEIYLHSREEELSYYSNKQLTLLNKFRELYDTIKGDNQ